MLGKKHLKKIEKLRERYKIFFTIIGVTGMILVWRGIWVIFDTLPYVNNPWVSLALGLVFVVISGIFFKLI